MKKTIYLIFLCLMVNSCGRMFKSKKSEVDSSLYMNNIIQYGDSAYNLAIRGLATPNIGHKWWYDLKDKTFEGISFEFAIANLNDSNIVVSLLYSINLEDEQKIKIKADSLNSICFRKYGKPIKDSTYVEKSWFCTENWHKLDFRDKYKDISVSLCQTDYKLNSPRSYGIYVGISIKDEIVKKHKMRKLEN